MRTLKDLINLELQKLVQKNNLDSKYCNINNFIEDPKLVVNFIEHMLDDSSFGVGDNSHEVYDIAQLRAKHSILLFLIGLVFKDFGGLFERFATTFDYPDSKIGEKLWMIVALSHDVAYSSKRIKPSYLISFIVYVFPLS